MEDYNKPRYVRSIWYNSNSAVVPMDFLVVYEGEHDWFVYDHSDNRNHNLPKSEYILLNSSPLKST